MGLAESAPVAIAPIIYVPRVVYTAVTPSLHQTFNFCSEYVVNSTITSQALSAADVVHAVPKPNPSYSFYASIPSYFEPVTMFRALVNFPVSTLDASEFEVSATGMGLIWRDHGSKCVSEFCTCLALHASPL